MTGSTSRGRFIPRDGTEPARWLFQFILSIRILEGEDCRPKNREVFIPRRASYCRVSGFTCSSRKATD